MKFTLPDWVNRRNKNTSHIFISFDCSCWVEYFDQDVGTKSMVVVYDPHPVNQSTLRTVAGRFQLYPAVSLTKVILLWVTIIGLVMSRIITWLTMFDDDDEDDDDDVMMMMMMI